MILPNNPYVAVLDACVLLPMPLCDTLLRLAEEPFPLYQVRWTRQILAEIQRNFTKLRPACGGNAAGPQLAQKRIRQMQCAFPDAMVDGFEGLIPAMCNDTNDRHVLAAAVHGQAHAIVTDNLRHFPADCAARFSVDALVLKLAGRCPAFCALVREGL